MICHTRINRKLIPWAFRNIATRWYTFQVRYPLKNIKTKVLRKLKKVSQSWWNLCNTAHKVKEQNICLFKITRHNAQQTHLHINTHTHTTRERENDRWDVEMRTSFGYEVDIPSSFALLKFVCCVHHRIFPADYASGYVLYIYIYGAIKLENKLRQGQLRARSMKLVFRYVGGLWADRLSSCEEVLVDKTCSAVLGNCISGERGH